MKVYCFTVYSVLVYKSETNTAIDVCIIPYVVSELTRYLSPLKLYEYLAAGKAVVSTPQPEVLEFTDVVTVAHTIEEFERCIAATLRQDSPGCVQQRLIVAAQHSWAQRVEEMSEIIERYLRTRGVNRGFDVGCTASAAS